MSPLVRRSLIAILVLSAIAAATWALIPRPLSVETTRATKGRFTATVDEDGKARVRERYVIAAPLSGHLNRIRYKVGDPLKVDDVIATILPPPAPLLDPRARAEIEERLGAAEANLERGKASVERARSQHDQAEADLTRSRTLVQQGARTAQALEHAELAARLARRDLNAAEYVRHAAEHELSQMRALLARYRAGAQPDQSAEAWVVRAPAPGVVLKVTQESETVVQAGASLLDIGDPHDLEIVVDVLSTDAVDIKRGARVHIINWGGDSQLEGIVRRVEPVAFTKVSTLGVEEQRANVLVDLTSPTQDWLKLGDGYQVDARIVVFERDDAVIIPAGALFRSGGVWQAFVVEGGRARLRDVQVLRRSGQEAAIASGLTEGEVVIVYPSDRVAPNVRVTPR